MQFSVPAFELECGGSITVTNFAAANVDGVLIEPGDFVIDGDGTFALDPGDYTAVGFVGEEIVTDEVPFTIEECPVGEPTPTPTPEDSVGGETETPTLPPTDTLGGNGAAPDSNTLAVLLVILTGTVASALVLTPHRSRRRG